MCTWSIRNDELQSVTHFKVSNWKMKTITYIVNLSIVLKSLAFSSNWQEFPSSCISIFLCSSSGIRLSMIVCICPSEHDDGKHNPNVMASPALGLILRNKFY